MGYPTVHLEVRELQYLVRALATSAGYFARTSVSSWLAERLDRFSEILLLQLCLLICWGQTKSNFVVE